MWKPSVPGQPDRIWTENLYTACEELLSIKQIQASSFCFGTEAKQQMQIT